MRILSYLIKSMQSKNACVNFSIFQELKYWGHIRIYVYILDG